MTQSEIVRLALWRCLASTAAAVIAVLLVRITAVAGASIVGSGTPESCTETALDEALVGGGPVTFTCGTEPMTITISSTKVIAVATAIDGGGRVTIGGSGTVRLFMVKSGASLQISNLTLANGYLADGAGAAVQVDGGTLTITNSTLTGNRATGGAGGAIFASSGSTVTITASMLAGNLANAQAGGIYNDGGTVTITNSTLTHNGSSHSGGGIGAGSGSITIINSTLAGNFCSEGGGAIQVGRGDVTVVNSTLAGNSAGGGGGIYIYGYAPNLVTLINSTLAGNRDSYNLGGGIHNEGHLTLVNTLIAGTSPGGHCQNTASGTTTDGGHNLIEDAANACGITNGVNGNIVGIDPMLDSVGLADHGGPTQTIALLANGPAVAAGDQAVCATPPVDAIDQRGYLRPGTDAVACCIGSYEYNASGPPGSCVGDCSSDGEVTVDELITMVNIALGTANVGTCTAGDGNGDGEITIDEIVTGVNYALNQCPGR
ncbi:MAG: hypothetical protein HY270_20485 [Deltaproteobacteria bacterium]|nr:hypothetical protein [Deltaproteobacteria bacterium]